MTGELIRRKLKGDGCNEHVYYNARLGRERALTYKTMIYTGLRKGELASLTVSALHLNGDGPHLELAAKNAKSGHGARIPLRADLAEDLRDHLAGKLDAYRRRTLADGRTEYPDALPGNTKLFNVPRDFIKIFDRDLEAAGIAKTDAQGRTVDIHCLRHTFATMLSQAGVAPRMAQELLRHSDIRLTMNTYTHLQLLDTAGAVEALPGLPAPDGERNRQVWTGTDGRICGAEIGDERQENRGASRQGLTNRPERRAKTGRAKTSVNREEKRPRSFSDKGRQKAAEGIRTLDVQLGKRLRISSIAWLSR
jgi:hypothetical protein